MSIKSIIERNSDYIPYIVFKYLDDVSCEKIEAVYPNKSKQYLSSGRDGMIFLVEESNVVKITTDVNEAVIMMNIMMKRSRGMLGDISKNLPVIHKVRRVNDFLYMIEMNKYKAKHIDSNSFFMFSDYIQTNEYSSNIRERLQEYFKLQKINSYDIDLLCKVSYIIFRLKQMGITYNDVYHENILFDKDEPILIDFAKSGYSFVNNEHIIEM
jgi:thiamine kinase-like enzyme